MKSVKYFILFSILFLLAACTEPGAVDEKDNLVVLKKENEALRDYITELKTPDVEYVEVPVEIVKEVEVPRDLTEEELELVKEEVRKELETEYNKKSENAVSEDENAEVDLDTRNYTDEEYLDLEDKYNNIYSELESLQQDYDALVESLNDLLSSIGVTEVSE